MEPAAEAKVELAAEVLRSRGELRFRATGASMIPAIWPGTVLRVRREGAAGAGPGDVILFERDGSLVAHRVVRRLDSAEGPVWITRGDRNRHEDAPVLERELLGLVEGVRPQTAVQRAAAFILRRSWFATRVALFLRRRWLERAANDAQAKLA